MRLLARKTDTKENSIDSVTHQDQRTNNPQLVHGIKPRFAIAYIGEKINRVSLQVAGETLVKV